MKTQNLVGAVHSYYEKETTFWIVNSMNSKCQDRRRDNVKNTKNAKTSTLKRCLSRKKD